MEKTKILGLGIVLMLLVGMVFATGSIGLAKAPSKSYTGTCYVVTPNAGIVKFPCAMRDYVTLPVHEDRVFHIM